MSVGIPEYADVILQIFPPWSFVISLCGGEIFYHKIDFPVWMCYNKSNEPMEG